MFRARRTQIRRNFFVSIYPSWETAYYLLKQILKSLADSIRFNFHV